MAITVTTGSAQTTSGPTRVPYVTLPADYVLSKDTAGEALYTNIGAPVTQPNSLRLAVSNIADVYTKAGVPTIAGQRTSGKQILVQINEVWKVTDAAVATFVPYYLPIQAHMVLRLPDDDQITSSLVATLIQRLEGALQHAAGTTLADGVNTALHGIVRF